jgi:hypothetical protein
LVQLPVSPETVVTGAVPSTLTSTVLGVSTFPAESVERNSYTRSPSVETTNGAA